MNSDAELLRRYAREGAEEAFDELVQRHVDLVYSAALRCLNGDVHRAEDVTQEVFAEMARKSTSLMRHPTLLGWLYVAARRMSSHAVRSEQRRMAREKEAIKMTDLHVHPAGEDDWKELRPVIDSAMEQLRADDRVAILLRFFQKKSFHEVGMELGLRENAARMRVDRALSKLRTELLRHGVSSTTTALASALLANGVFAASPTFVSTITARSLAKATACSGAGAAAGFGIFNWIAMTKAQLAAAGGVVIVAGTVALIVFHRDDSMLTVEAAESIQAGQTAVTGGEQDMASASEQPGAAPSIAALSQNQTAEIVTAAEAQKEVSSIVEDWEGLASIFDDVEIYTKQIKRLTEIGPAATPPLCAALEKTTRDAPLRLIPFALRAIGDARAIPALIRTIQKTLRPSGSDCGINVTDVEVLRFMQGNDVSTVEGYAKDRVAGFDMARPVREVAASLHKLTRTNLNEAEIFQTFLEGGEPQRAAQRMAYYRVANNWANWWKENAGRFVQDASTNDVELSIAMPPTSKAQSSNQGFLTGPNIKLTGGTSGAVLRPVEYGTNCALQLTVGRRINLPSELLKTATASLRAVEDWAMSAGADLAGGQYSDGDSTKAYFALQGIGMQAWEVSNESWGEIEKILERGAFPTLGRRAGDWLMKYDEVQNHYRPEKKATFVFITRDGLQGILRVTAQVTESSAPRTGLLYIPPDESGEDQRTTSGFESGVQFDYRFFYAETDELKSEEAARRQATSEREAARKERKMARLFEAHPKIGGTVRLPNGEPARGAQVLLAVPGEGAVLGRQGFENAGYITMVETRADGRFEIPHVPSARRIYAAHADGFAEVNIDDTPPPFSIQLKRWGAIAGRVERGGKASPHAKVAIISGYVEPGTALTLSFYQIDADAEGRFAFTNLPPGEIQICRVLKNTFYEGQITSVIAGETTSIRLGSEGRTVKGRFRTSDNSAAEWSKNPGFYFHPKEQQRSEAESAKPRRMTRMPVHVSSDGEFRIEDVVPGVYDFRGDLREGAGNDDWQFGRTLGRFKQELIVPDGRGDFDVGEITVEMLGNP